MSDIYLSLTETPSVVTLSQPVIASSVAATVTVGNTVTVALDANSLSALEQVTVTVGAAVSVSNFPSTQTIAGTVTANVTGQVSVSNQPSEIIIKGYDFIDDEYEVLKTDQDGVLLVAPNGTIAVVGTVTANPTGTQAVAGTVTVSNQQTLISYSGQITATAGPAILARGEYSGTGWTTLQGIFTDMRENGVGIPIGLPSGVTSLGVSVSNTVTIGSLPAISGTVTANSIFPRVTLIDGSGTVATANTAITVFASSSTRSYLLVQVTTGSAFVNVGATATTVNGINLTAGQGYAWETTIPQGVVSLISTTTSSRWVAKEA